MSKDVISLEVVLNERVVWEKHIHKENLQGNNGFVSVTTQVGMSPEDVAEIFWGMACYEQAAFFNHLAKISDGFLCKQMASVDCSRDLTNKGRDAMRIIGDHAQL